MTEKRRIFLNIIATYGRSLYALVCGLFTARWTLQSLGEVNYGLFGVIGGLMVFIAFFNSVFAGAIGRFYAVSVGQAKRAGSCAEGVEECRRWFNTALSIHLFVPFLLILIGYPIGEWAVRHWLTIPFDRIEACVWVFRFACLSCFVGMVNVPFTAMYTAKQYIAELTIYSFISTTLNVGFLCYMVNHPGDWLARLALWSMLLSVVPQVIICLRALKIFPECKIRIKYWFEMERLKQVGRYAGWQMLGIFCSLMRNQGMSILTNKMFGPSVNAAQSLASTVNGHTSTLAGALLGAFMPAVTTAFGEGDLPKMRAMAIRACKFGVLLSLLFMLPLSLELTEVLRLWLKNPPEYVYGLCLCMLATHLADVSTKGHMVVVNASGKIAMYQVVLSAINIFTVPIGFILAWCGCGVYISIGIVMFLGITLNSIGRIIFARFLMGMSIRTWLNSICFPTMLLIVAVGTIGYLPQIIFAPSIGRIVCTGLITSSLFVALSWMFVLDHEEREFIRTKLMQTPLKNFLRKF